MCIGRLPVQVERAVEGLIRRYDLHDDPWSVVPIRQVARDEGWQARWSESMAGVYGLAVVGRGIKVMTINAAVSCEYQRWAMAHEMGHVLCGHDPRYPAMCASPASGLDRLAEWIEPEQEREAHAVAARLLIADGLYRRLADEAIARVAVVPVRLVEIGREGYRARSRAQAGRRLGVRGRATGRGRQAAAGVEPAVSQP